MEDLLETLIKMDCKGPRLDKLPKEVVAGITAHCGDADRLNLSQTSQSLRDEVSEQGLSHMLFHPSDAAELLAQLVDAKCARRKTVVLHFISDKKENGDHVDIDDDTFDMVITGLSQIDFVTFNYGAACTAMQGIAIAGILSGKNIKMLLFRNCTVDFANWVSLVASPKTVLETINFANFHNISETTDYNFPSLFRHVKSVALDGCGYNYANLTHFDPFIKQLLQACKPATVAVRLITYMREFLEVAGPHITHLQFDGYYPEFTHLLPGLKELALDWPAPDQVMPLPVLPPTVETLRMTIAWNENAIFSLCSSMMNVPGWVGPRLKNIEIYVKELGNDPKQKLQTPCIINCLAVQRAEKGLNLNFNALGNSLVINGVVSDIISKRCHAACGDNEKAEA